MRKFLNIFIILCLSSSAFSQEAGSMISGKVTDESGSPLTGAAIRVEGMPAGTIAGADGLYRLTGLPDGTHTIEYSFLGYATERKTVELRGSAGIDVILHSEAFVTGEVLVMATRAGEHTPLAYTTVEREQLMKSSPVQDIPFLLGLTPSFVETSESGNGIGYTGMRIRGTDANRINVTIDGIPLNDPESHTVFWVDLPDLSSSVDNIQIQRGVGTSSSGAGAFGATVSIQTLNPGSAPSAEVSSTYGSFNTLKNTISASTGMLKDKFALMMRYSDLESDGYVDRTWADHRSAYVSGVFRSGRSRFKANVILGEEHTGLGWWGVPADSLAVNRTYNPAGEYTDENGRITYYDNESDNYNQDHYQLIYSLDVAKDLNLNAAMHYTRGKGYYEEYREDQELAEYGIPFPGGTVEETDLIRRKWLDNHFYGLVYSLGYRTGNAELVTGGGINRYLGDHYGTLIWMRNAGTVEKDHRWYFNSAVKSEFSLYGKLNYTLSEATRLFVDLQYRHIYYDMNGPDDDQKDLTQAHDYGFFNPKAGFFWSINDSNEAWVSFSVANREPTRNDFKEAAGDPDATPKPETLYDAEAGYNLRFGRSSLALNLYGMYYRDQLVPTGELSDVGYSIMTNVDRSYRTGIELTGSFRLHDNLSFNPSATLSSNRIISLTEHYVNYSGDETQYLSKELGNVNIAYSPSAVFSGDLGYEKGMFGVHLLSKYVGKQYFDNTMSEDRSIDPYFVNNLRFSFTPKLKNAGNLELQLWINNIFNQKYVSNAYGGNWYEEGVEKTWAYYFPQAGTNWLVRAALKF